MNKAMRRGAGRTAVAVLAAVGLLFGVLAAPATASSAPNETSIMGLLKGGELRLFGDPDDVVFPFGEKGGDPSVCDKQEGRSNVTADVDENGDMDNFVFHFAQESRGIKGVRTIFGINIHYEICTKITIKNDNFVGGEIDGKSVDVFAAGAAPNDEIRMSVDWLVKAQQDVPFLGISRGDVLEDCRVDPVWVDLLTGAFDDPKDPYPDKDPHDWNLELALDAPFSVPAVPSTSECSSSTADEINSWYGLPTAGTADFKFIVYDEG